jgi:DNA-binding NtrC family response regulator
LEQGNVISKEQLSFLRMDVLPPAAGFQQGAGRNRSEIELSPGEYTLRISKQGAPFFQVLRDLIAQTFALSSNDTKVACKMLGLSETKLNELINELGLEQHMQVADKKRESRRIQKPKT